MGQEFFINSQALQDKISSLLPSQGGAGAGFDLSASTQIIPIIDLTESAEGSNVRQDLQTAVSATSATVFDTVNTTTTVITTTGYFRVLGSATCETSGSVLQQSSIILNDGSNDKIVWAVSAPAESDGAYIVQGFDFIIFLNAGDSFKVKATGSAQITGSTRQIADIEGNISNPL